MHTFNWAIYYRENELLADLLDCRMEKQDDHNIWDFITHRSTEGPLVTNSLKSGNLGLFNKCLQSSEVDVCSQDKDGYTPPLTVKKQHDPIFKQVLLKVLRNERDEENWKRASTILLDALKIGRWTIPVLMLGSLWTAS